MTSEDEEEVADGGDQMILWCVLVKRKFFTLDNYDSGQISLMNL